MGSGLNHLIESLSLTLPFPVCSGRNLDPIDGWEEDLWDFGIMLLHLGGKRAGVQMTPFETYRLMYIWSASADC